MPSSTITLHSPLPSDVVKPKPIFELPNVQMTYQYSMFKTMPANRSVSKTHIQELIDSFYEHPELVALDPVLVNEYNEIVDGQHRVRACEVLEYPVFYIRQAGIKVSTAQLLNGLQRPWKLIDYVYSYAQGDYTDYKIFYNLVQDYDLPPSVLLKYIIGHKRNLYQSKNFKLGKFKIEDTIPVIRRRLDFLSSFGRFGSYTRSQTFARALLQAMRKVGDSYDNNRMVEGYRALSLGSRGPTTDYLRDLEQAYNRNISPNSKSYVRFF